LWLPWLPWLRLAWLQVRRLRWLLLTLGTVPHLLTSRGISVRRRLSASLVSSAFGPASRVRRNIFVMGTRSAALSEHFVAIL
jgi:hypothetical protein